MGVGMNMNMGMSMGISSDNSNTIRRTIKKADGTTAGTITTTKSAKKKTKRLPYNFKKVSSQIMASKTSSGARKAVTAARGMVAMLQRKLRTGEYDDEELENAIAHAKKMERVARKRMRHMQQEENAKRSEATPFDPEEVEESDSEETKEKQEPELSEEDLEKAMQEFQEFMADFQEDMQEESLQELADELLTSTPTDMAPEDLERLKKKHRAQEAQEIMKADMAYLKALFDKLEKDKQSDSTRTAGSGGVSLELSGVDIPVEISEVPMEVMEGGNVDVSV